MCPENHADEDEAFSSVRGGCEFGDAGGDHHEHDEETVEEQPAKQSTSAVVP